MAEQGLVFFPGIKQVQEGSYTLTHGITPSAATVTILPQGDFAGQGSLVFTYGNKKIELPDCLVDNLSFERNQSGEIWRLAIYDRRWKWAYGKISGMYNVRKLDGKIVGGSNTKGSTISTNTEKKPSELAKLCFEAIEESNYDLSEMPDDTRPFVEWDVANPMQALADLCEEVGCRIVLGWDNKVRICRRGQGGQLPSGPDMMTDSGGIDPPDGFNSITVTTDKVLFQHDFPLEAVGFELDGAIKKIDDLSYKPEGGWEDIDLVSFNGIKDTKLRELAQSCVFKTYRLIMPVTIPDYKEVKDFDLLGLTGEQVLTAADYDSKNKLLPERQTKALVYGDYYQQNGNYTNTGTKELPQVPTKEEMKTVILQFNQDNERGLVTFNDYTFKLNKEKTTVEPAVLKLRCATYVRDDKTRGWIRWERGRGKNKGKAPPQKVLQQEDIKLNFRDGKNNKAEVDQQIDYYLDAALAELQLLTPQTRAYAGLKEIEPDGAIQQVTISVGLGGCTTQASRSNDHDLNTPSYETRRFYERLRNQKKLTDTKIKKAAK
jgi:hypothetical protein